MTDSCMLAPKYGDKDISCSLVSQTSHLPSLCIFLDLRCYLCTSFNCRIFVQVNVTADHRIIYGADLAAFLQTFAKIIQNPDSLTL